MENQISVSRPETDMGVKVTRADGTVEAHIAADTVARHGSEEAAARALGYEDLEVVVDESMKPESILSFTCPDCACNWMEPESQDRNKIYCPRCGISGHTKEA